MALPTILVDSATGSDTAASGAGPSTAITGSAGVSVGLTITVDGSPDLSGVATDGSAVFFFNDTTLNARNFSKITAVNNSTKVVTVSDTLGFATKAWAIGGKRATIGGTLSTKLFEQGIGSGDAMPGWIIQMASGHSETIAATITCRRSGDSTSGTITLRGIAGAATLPLLTFSNNGVAITVTTPTVAWTFQNFEMQNTNGTKTASIGIAATGLAHQIKIKAVKISHVTNFFWKGVQTGCYDVLVQDSEIGYCANIGLEVASSGFPVRIFNNWIHNCTSHGIGTLNTCQAFFIVGNIIDVNGGAGISHDAVNTSNTAGAAWLIMGNTIVSNTTSGIIVSAASTSLGIYNALTIINNILSSNTSYGLSFTGSGVTAALLDAMQTIVDCNNTFNNGVAGYNPAGYGGNDPGLNPVFNTGYQIGSNLLGKGYPIGGSLKIGSTNAASSYVDIGAAQRNELTAQNSLVLPPVCTY